METIINENEAIIISAPGNLFYFTGLKNSDAYALFIGNEKYYFTDSRYFEDAQEKLNGFILKDVVELHDFIKNAQISSLGIEENTLSHGFCAKLQSDGVKAFYGVDNRIKAIRAIKSSTEIELIKKAQEITDTAFSELLPLIKEGMTEAELAGTLESLMYVHEAEETAFSTIVAFGENSSKPHAERTRKKLTKGSVILIDCGAKFGNYCSDMTRTIFFGEPSAEIKQTYEDVLTAQQMALGVMYPGMTGRECDAMARNYFKELGLEKHFIHSLGHGVGIDIHEHPRLAQGSDTVMKENMVVTVEPGLYFPGKYGIRIEDLVIFDKTGIINLTKSPKNMIII